MEPMQFMTFEDPCGVTSNAILQGLRPVSLSRGCHSRVLPPPLALPPGTAPTTTPAPLFPTTTTPLQPPQPKRQTGKQHNPYLIAPLTPTFGHANDNLVLGRTASTAGMTGTPAGGWVTSPFYPSSSHHALSASATRVPFGGACLLSSSSVTPEFAPALSSRAAAASDGPATALRVPRASLCSTAMSFTPPTAPVCPHPLCDFQPCGDDEGPTESVAAAGLIHPGERDEFSGVVGGFGWGGAERPYPSGEAPMLPPATASYTELYDPPFNPFGPLSASAMALQPHDGAGMTSCGEYAQGSTMGNFFPFFHPPGLSVRVGPIQPAVSVRVGGTPAMMHSHSQVSDSPHIHRLRQNQQEHSARNGLYSARTSYHSSVTAPYDQQQQLQQTRYSFSGSRSCSGLMGFEQHADARPPALVLRYAEAAPRDVLPLASLNTWQDDVGGCMPHDVSPTDIPTAHVKNTDESAVTIAVNDNAGSGSAGSGAQLGEPLSLSCIPLVLGGSTAAAEAASPVARVGALATVAPFGVGAAYERAAAPTRCQGLIFALSSSDNAALPLPVTAAAENSLQCSVQGQISSSELRPSALRRVSSSSAAFAMSPSPFAMTTASKLSQVTSPAADQNVLGESTTASPTETAKTDDKAHQGDEAAIARAPTEAVKAERGTTVASPAAALIATVAADLAEKLARSAVLRRLADTPWALPPPSPAVCPTPWVGEPLRFGAAIVGPVDHPLYYPMAPPPLPFGGRVLVKFSVMQNWYVVSPTVAAVHPSVLQVGTVVIVDGDRGYDAGTVLQVAAIGDTQAVGSALYEKLQGRILPLPRVGEKPWRRADAATAAAPSAPATAAAAAAAARDVTTSDEDSNNTDDDDASHDDGASAAAAVVAATKPVMLAVHRPATVAEVEELHTTHRLGAREPAGFIEAVWAGLSAMDEYLGAAPKMRWAGLYESALRSRMTGKVQVRTWPFIPADVAPKKAGCDPQYRPFVFDATDEGVLQARYCSYIRSCPRNRDLLARAAHLGVPAVTAAFDIITPIMALSLPAGHAWLTAPEPEGWLRWLAGEQDLQEQELQEQEPRRDDYHPFFYRRAHAPSTPTTDAVAAAPNTLPLVHAPPGANAAANGDGAGSTMGDSIPWTMQGVLHLVSALPKDVAVQLVLQSNRVACSLCGTRIVAIERQFGAPHSVGIFACGMDYRGRFRTLVRMLNARLRVRIWYVDISGAEHGQRRCEVKRRLAAAVATRAALRNKKNNDDQNVGSDDERPQPLRDSRCHRGDGEDASALDRRPHRDCGTGTRAGGKADTRAAPQPRSVADSSRRGDDAPAKRGNNGQLNAGGRGVAAAAAARFRGDDDRGKKRRNDAPRDDKPARGRRSK